MTRRRTRNLTAALAAAGTLFVAACGSSGDTGAGTVKIGMHDIGYSTGHVTVPAGKEVTFEFHNTGKVVHEAFLGDDAAQDAHEAEMKAMGSGGMAGMATDAHALTIKPGTTRKLTHTFKAGDRLFIGCHETGHYAAGMKVTIDVAQP